MWNNDEVKGKVDKAKGKGEQALGDLTNDERMRDRGEADEASGNVQDAVGKGRRKVGEALDDLGDKLKD